MWCRGLWVVFLFGSGCVLHVSDPGSDRVNPADDDDPIEVGSTEVCNGIDDDLDGEIDEGDLCAALCPADGLEGAHVPAGAYTGGDVISAITEVPSWCTGDELPPEDAVTVACGEVLTVSGGLIATDLYVAPGGVLRVEGDAVLAIDDTLMVCAGGTIQGSGAPALGQAGDGSNLSILAPTVLNWGTIDTSGGTAFDPDLGVSGDAGSLSIIADRLLHDGELRSFGSNRIDGTGDLSGGDGGAIYIESWTESWFAGCVATSAGLSGLDLESQVWGENGAPGSITLMMAVCCADVEDPAECPA